MFLAYQLLSERIQSVFAQQLRGTTIKGIPREDLKQIELLLPPLHEQVIIASILSAIDDKLQAEESKKTSIETLFRTMLSLLMTGKMRVKDLEV